MMIGALCVLLVSAAVVSHAQVTRILGASLVRECVRDDPAEDATVDSNCTDVRTMVKVRVRATPTTGNGQIIEVFLDSEEFDQAFDNTTNDPTIPVVASFEATRLVVNMSEIRVRYATRFWLSIPDEYFVWSRDFAGALRDNCDGEPVVVSTDPTSPLCYENAPCNPFTDVNCEVLPQNLLPPGQQFCTELSCGDCLVDTTGVSDDRNGPNLERFWWSNRLNRVYRVKPEPIIEYTIVVEVIPPDGPSELVILGLQEGLGLEQQSTVIEHSDSNTLVDDATGEVWPPEPSDGRQFQTVAFSANNLVRVRLVTQGRFGVVPPFRELIIAREPDPATGGPAGYEEGRENPRAFGPDACAIFVSANESTALCQLPELWFTGRNFQDELRVGDDCCSCLGITQAYWLTADPSTGTRSNAKRACWDAHFTCVPGVDFWSKDRTQTPIFFRERRSNFRLTQYRILCRGDPDADVEFVTGINPGQCDFDSVSGAESTRRVTEAALQAPTNLPPMWSNTGRSNMWMHRGQMFLDPAENLGQFVTLIIDFEGAFGGVIQRIPTVRLEGIEFGEDCSVVVGEGGELYGRLVNESPFAGDFSVALSCQPPYQIVGPTSFGIGLLGDESEEFAFQVTVTRDDQAPDPEGGQCTIQLFDFAGQDTGQSLDIQCREEQAAFPGSVGVTSDLDECSGGIDCGWWGIIIIALIALLLIFVFLLVRKCIRRS